MDPIFEVKQGLTVKLGKEKSKNTDGKRFCKTVNHADFASRLLDFVNKGRERYPIIKYFMRSTDTWVILLNIIKSHYKGKAISISDSLKGTLFTKESGIAFIKKSSEGTNRYLEIYDDTSDKRKKTVSITKEVKDAFEMYCSKLSVCIDDPSNSNDCIKVL